ATSASGGSTFLPSFFPSYQCRVTAGMSPRAGKVMVTWAELGQVCGFTSVASATTFEGLPSLSAMNAMLAVWQAMSPMAPVPKSQCPRQLNAWYAPLSNRVNSFLAGSYSAYSRIGAGPMNASQFRVFGTGFDFGRVSGMTSGACGQTGRLVHTCTSVTFPS